MNNAEFKVLVCRTKAVFWGERSTMTSFIECVLYMNGFVHSWEGRNIIMLVGI